MSRSRSTELISKAYSFPVLKDETYQVYDQRDTKNVLQNNTEACPHDEEIL